MYCPNCNLEIQESDNTQCPLCSSPLLENPESHEDGSGTNADELSALIDSINQQVSEKLDFPSAGVSEETSLPFEPIVPLSDDALRLDTNQPLPPLEQDALELDEQAPPEPIPAEQTISAQQEPPDFGAPADLGTVDSAQQEALLPPDQNMTVDAVFRQIMHEKTAELEAAGSQQPMQASAEESDRQYRASAEFHNDTEIPRGKMPKKIFDKAFEEMALDEQIARKPRKKSLAVPMLLCALFLCGAVAGVIYFLNPVALFVPEQKAPAKVLPKPVAKVPTPVVSTAQAPQTQKKAASDNATLPPAQAQPQPAPQPATAAAPPAVAPTPATAAAGPSADTPPAAVTQKPVIPAEQPQEPAIAEQKPAANKPAPEVASVAEAPKEPPSRKEAAAVKNIAAGTGGDFMLLAGSYKIENKAIAEASRLKAKGYNAILEKVNLGAKGTWHRVEIIGFESKEAAENAGKILKQNEKIDSIVTKRK